MIWLKYVLVYFSLSVFLIYMLSFFWKRRHSYLLAWKFTGPLALPVIGNAYIFICKNEDILMKIHNVVEKYAPRPFRFWLGLELVIVLPSPEYVEKILKCSKFSQKHDIYRFPQVFLGNGLITGSGGSQMKQHRRIIQPMFDANLSSRSIPVMQSHIDLCMKRLEPYVGKGDFDFFHVIHACMADIIKEIILGSDERSQISGSTDFDQGMLDIYDFAFSRMVKPWQQPDFLLSLFGLKKRQDELRTIVRSKAKQMLDDAFNRIKLYGMPDELYPIIDRIMDYVMENPNVLDDETLIDNILTLYTASEDTLSIISAFLAMCLGMDSECQNKAAEEIRSIFGETPKPVTKENISKLCYIEMCIKETLRLFPIAPIILRKPIEDFELDKLLVPKGCALMIPIFTLHRDPRYWQKPNEFYPEHFSPEAENKRPIYSYIPFSAGPRGCIGKPLAYTGLKIFICNLLQQYEIECDGTVPELKIKMDISTRPVNGCYLRLKKRVWK